MVAHGIFLIFITGQSRAKLGRMAQQQLLRSPRCPISYACSNFNALVQHIDPSSVPKPTPDSELFLYQRKSVFKNKPSAYYVGATFLFSALVRGKHLLFTRTTLVH